MTTKVFKFSKGGMGCPICQHYGSKVSHNCMFEEHNARYIVNGVDPKTHKVFNWWLAKRSKDPEIQSIVRQELKQIKQISPSTTMNDLVVPSYNRMFQYFNSRPELQVKQKSARRDRNLIG